VLALAAKYVDSAVSKTCNVGDDVTYDEFKDMYLNAWKLG
jgi:ribonucleoside-diphosphate reductase alpha chain